MPRELIPKSSQEPVQLTQSPETKTPDPSDLSLNMGEEQPPIYHEDAVYASRPQDVMRVPKPAKKGTPKDHLHPFVQTLSKDDVESCVALENASFPENERCSREKVFSLRSLFSPFA